MTDPSKPKRERIVIVLLRGELSAAQALVEWALEVSQDIPSSLRKDGEKVLEKFNKGLEEE